MESQQRDDVDGRRLRRERNREAVVDALLELYGEGNLNPSSSEVAERAGSSPRSLFRYFDDVDDLCTEAVRRHESRVIGHVVLAVAGDADLDARISALVASRVALWEASGPVGQVARLRAPFQPLIAAQLAQGRTFLRNQIKKLFAAELASLDADRAAAVLASADVLLSYEGYRLLRDAQGHGRSRVSQLLEESLRSLFANASVA